MARYSLWLMPTGLIQRKYALLIAQLAEEYASPVFPPHVTLIGRIEDREEDAIIKVREVAASLHPYTIKLADVAFTDAYYRALFVKVEPTSAVSGAYQKATEIVNGQREKDNMPHLSLLYGDFPVERKEQTIKRIGERFTDEFQVETLHLYCTEGTVGEWRSIQEFPLR